MTPNENDLAERAQVLTESVDALKASVSSLTDATKGNRRAIRWAFVSIAVDVLLSVVLLFAGVAVAHLMADQTASKDAQCSLYALILRGDTPERRAAMPPEELADYVEAIAVIRRDAESLNC